MRLCFGVIHIHPRVFLKRDSFSPLILDVLLCKSLFYRKILSNLDKNIPVGYQESLSKSLFGYLCPSINDDCCKSEVHAECSKSVAGGLRWPVSTTNAGDARYRDSEFCYCII